MRFNRASRVEVLIKKKLPSGVWLSAEIVSGNKDSYTVRYNRRPSAPEVVEKVPLEDVRPCPPPVTSLMIWSVGDVVEVFDDYCWKTSVIQEDMSEGYYYIHVFGSIDEFKVQKSQIRVRQQWKDDNWSLRTKDSGICDDLFYRMFKKAQMKLKSDVTIAQEVLEPVMKTQTLKRSSPDSLYPDSDKVFAESARKRNAVEDQREDCYSFIGKDMERLVSHTTTRLKMLVWLASISLVSRKGLHLCLLLYE